MYNANYMDGVPVRIAEKYKPPPTIYKLPLSLANKLSLDANYYRDCPMFSYDLQLEKKALSKIEQWKRIRQQNKELRRERISKREEHRKRESEDKQKNLLYSVSYPSTDDLSSEEDEKIELDKQYDENKEIAEYKETAPQICVTETINSFHNILQPTVLSCNSNKSNSTNIPLTPLVKSTFDNKLLNSFNYKDFEEDTSSPFDNMELKTINDLDVLAQVLHNTQIKSQYDEKRNEDVVEVPSDNTNQKPVDCNLEQKLNQEINTDSLNAAENIPKTNKNLPKFSSDYNSTQEVFLELKCNRLTFESAMHYNDNLPASTPITISPNHQYNGLNCTNEYNDFSSNRIHNRNNIVSESPQPCRLQAVTEDKEAKSKSVPNILKELQDEIRNSEIRRYRNCSYKIKESSKIYDACSVNARTITNNTEIEDTLSHMDSKAKELVEKISAMGFPLKRVARIVHLLGADDKKVIEHLIPLSELVDLGFEESKISEALIRNENNKNKALDDLIS